MKILLCFCVIAGIVGCSAGKHHRQQGGRSRRSDRQESDCAEECLKKDTSLYNYATDDGKRTPEHILPPIRNAVANREGLTAFCNQQKEMRTCLDACNLTPTSHSTITQVLDVILAPELYICNHQFEAAVSHGKCVFEFLTTEKEKNNCPRASFVLVVQARRNTPKYTCTELNEMLDCYKNLLTENCESGAGDLMKAVLKEFVAFLFKHHLTRPATDGPFPQGAAAGESQSSFYADFADPKDCYDDEAASRLFWLF